MFHIIGEKINGTREQVHEAIVGRDAAQIRSLAARQVEAGAHWIDVNAGTRPDREPDDLRWLVETVQSAVDVPLCLDSANPAALAAALAVTRDVPLINSITGEARRLDGVLPLARDHGCPLIALALDDSGIPTGTKERLAVIGHLLAATRAAGIPDERVFIDPLVMAVATSRGAGLIALDTITAVRADFSRVHITVGLSNVSFGLPARRLVNRTFLTLAVAAGLDTAILDPLDRELTATLRATEVLLGRDRHCLAYTRAYRSGLLDPFTPAASSAKSVTS
ncbi:MAG TPA: dihydropteroate synthase [Streptosporangiaceae bacterium]|nr:dihydropteroate synthase [Streptosporangiaceae bacterium]